MAALSAIPAEGRELKLYDSADPDQKSLAMLKLVDITGHCPDAEGTILMRYARTEKGPIVQFDQGPGLPRFHLGYANGIESMALLFDFGLQLHASRWGVDISKLVDLIIDCSPENSGH